MQNYHKWNEALFKYFFNDATKDKIVYLFVNKKVITEVGMNLDMGEADAIGSFCKSVSHFSPINSNLFRDLHVLTDRWWNNRKDKIPPFIGLLCLCVYAASKMEADQNEGVGVNNYYFRLREVLGFSGIGKPPYFENTINMWSKLYEWQQENNNRFGYTPSFPLGSKFAGLPRSQCLIRETDRHLLYQHFRECGYHKKEVVDKNVIKYDIELLFQRSESRLKRFFYKHPEAQEHFVTLIHSEYNDWLSDIKKVNLEDPKVKSEKITSGKIRRKSVDLKLFLQFKGRLSPQNLDLKQIAELEQDILSFPEELSGFDFRNNFLFRIVKNSSELLLPINKTLTKNNIKLSYKNSPLYIFRNADYLGLFGWISKETISKNEKHIILFKTGLKGNLDDWINKNAVILTSFKDTLLSGWSIILILTKSKIKNLVIDDIEFKEKKVVNVKAKGGLKIENKIWLATYPPKLTIFAPRASLVKINGLDDSSFSILESPMEIDLKNYDLGPGPVNLSVDNYNHKLHLADKQSFDLGMNNFYKIHPLNFKINGVDFSESENLLTINYSSHNRIYLIYKKSAFELEVPNEIKDSWPYSRKFSEVGISLSELKWRKIDEFVEYLSILKKGNQKAFTNGVAELFKDETVFNKILRNLLRLGFIEVEYKNGGDFSWWVTPTSASNLPCKEHDRIVFISGSRLYGQIGEWIRHSVNTSSRYQFYIPDSEYEPISIYLESKSKNELEKEIATRRIRLIQSYEYLAYDLASSIPSINETIESSKSVDLDEYINWKSEGWDIHENKWKEKYNSKFVRITNKLGISQYILKRNTSAKKVTATQGKIFIAVNNSVNIFSYTSYNFKVRADYQLPELYERVLTMCSGTSPIKIGKYLNYKNVPLEVALMILYKLGYPPSEI